MEIDRGPCRGGLKLRIYAAPVSVSATTAICNQDCGEVFSHFMKWSQIIVQ
jgi:hypothetical protein